jgi:uncharacterized protein YjaZ
VKRSVLGFLGAALACTVPIDPPSEASPGAAVIEPEIQIEDVARFYKVYDAADGHPSAEQLQRDYLDAGTEGLHRLAQLRRVTGAAIADAVVQHPAVFRDAKRCMAVLARARGRVAASLRRLGTLYPEAQFPSVTVAISRGKPIGVADAKGVMIGLEALCAVAYMESNLEDRVVHVIAHEYVHVQQAIASPALYERDKPTVLEESLIEGAAELTAELISGRVSYAHLDKLARDRATAIETEFVADEDKTDLSHWLYNGTLTEPGDLGYWVGYRIAKSYYEHARDKRQALRDILQMADAKALLARSGWRPGIRLRP